MMFLFQKKMDVSSSRVAEVVGVCDHRGSTGAIDSGAIWHFDFDLQRFVLLHCAVLIDSDAWPCW